MTGTGTVNQNALVGTKAQLDSNTIRGIILAAVGFLSATILKEPLAKIGLDVTGVTEFIVQGITWIGLAWAYVGRLTAKTKIA